MLEEPKTQFELDEEKKEKEEKEKLEKDKQLKLSHTQKVKQTKTQISVIRKINPKMKKEDMLLMTSTNGARKGLAMKIRTKLLGFKMVRFNMGAQGILIPRSVNNELEGKVDSIGDEDPAKNKIENKGPKWKNAVTSVKKWYVLSNYIHKPI